MNKLLTQRQITRRIHRIAAKATAETWAQGLLWYSNANQYCQELALTYNKPLDTVVGILAVISPFCAWPTNKASTRDILEVGDAPVYSGFRRNVKKAQRILKGETPNSVVSGHKVKAFYSNILNPCDSEQVTVDSHIAHIAFGKDTLTGQETDWVFRSGNKVVQKAYITLAPKYNVRPCELQAITWLVKKG